MAGKPAAVAALSLKLEDFVKSGLLPDGKYLLKSHSTMIWDYDGKVAGASTCCLKVVCQPITVDAKGKITEVEKEAIHYASAGDPARIGPTGDGTGFVAIGNTSGLAEDSNLYIWLKNLVGAGYPEDQFDNDVTVFDNMAVEIVNIPAPKRNIVEKSNLVQAGPPRQQRDDKTIPVVKVIGKMPNEKVWSASAGSTANKAAAPASAPASAPAASKPNGKAPAADAGEGPETLLAQHLETVLGDKKTFDRAAARVAVYKSMGAAGVSNDQRKAANDLFNDDATLTPILENLGGGYLINGSDIESLG